MVRIVTREQWGATVPLGPPMSLPVGELWLHHSVTALTDFPYADMRLIERIGKDRFGRFSYSWAYHARSRQFLAGAGDTIGAHTAGRNSTSLGLVLIGNFDDCELSDDNLADLREFIDWLQQTGRLKPGTYPTGGHRDLKGTACPGGNAYARLDDIRQPAPTPPEEDDMTPEQLARLAGPADRAAFASEKAVEVLGGMAQQLWTLLNSRTDVIDEEDLAKALAPLIVASSTSLSDTDLERIAEAVADEQAKRQAD